MTKKDDLLEEAAGLGLVLDDTFTNAKIQELIDSTFVEQAEEIETAGAVDVEEPTFTMEQLQPYADQLFGVGSHVLVGAQSAGTIPSGKMTKGQAQAGIDQYLNMPVEQVRRD